MAQTMQRSPRPGADAPVVNKGVDTKAPWPVQFYGTAVGKKWVMAITGLGLIGFVLAHMIGNLKLYLGKGANGVYQIDEYGESLRTLLHPILPNQVFIWILRIGLIVMFVLHIHAAVTLTRLNHLARPQGYKAPRRLRRCELRIEVDAVHRRHRPCVPDLPPLRSLVDGDRQRVRPRRGPPQPDREPPATVGGHAYIVANIALAIHLFHGTWSMFQSLGLEQPPVQRHPAIHRRLDQRPDRNHERFVPDPDPRRGREVKGQR